MTDVSLNFNLNEVTPSQETMHRNLLSTGSILGRGFTEIDKLIMGSSAGPLKSAITATYYGINNSGYIAAAQKNQEQQGLTFFTRPRMRLSAENCLQHSALQQMLVTRNQSPWRAVRAILDPVGSGSPQRITANREMKTSHLYPSDLIDPYMPFIPLLGNTLTSLTGWPDLDIGHYVAREGIQKETYTLIDGVANIYNHFTLNATFRNIVSDPIGYLFWAWACYNSSAYQGEATPWMDSILDNETDYQTRLYRIIFDPTRTFVQKIAYTGIATPIVANVGASYNFSQKPFNEELDDYQISFACDGAVYYSKQAFAIFNRHVQDFNVYMHDGKRQSHMVKLKASERTQFKFAGYPRINPENSEFEIWVFKELYQAMNRRFHGKL